MDDELLDVLLDTGEAEAGAEAEAVDPEQHGAELAIVPAPSGEDEDEDRYQEQAMTGFGSHAVVSRKARCTPVAKHLEWMSGA